jgi:hypothetical protein
MFQLKVRVYRLICENHVPAHITFHNIISRRRKAAAEFWRSRRVPALAAVKVTDALHHAQFIRNRAAAHGFNKLTRELTVTAISNVQRLVRELILRSTSHWADFSGKRSMGSALG